MPASAPPLTAAILGTDTLLAARPAAAVQLVRACLRLGFEFVAPVAWGEELVAIWLAERATQQAAGAAIAVSCPLVSEHVESLPHAPRALRAVPPPVASARYLRAAFTTRRVQVTYIGACPGALSAEIDHRMLPDILLARFIGAGIDLFGEPHHLDGLVPPMWSRYASRPGGTPDAGWLRSTAGTRIVEAADVTIAALAADARDHTVLIDLAESCQCVCARDRRLAALVEPPRVAEPMVASLAVSIDAERPATQPTPPLLAEPEPPTEEAERRAVFAENGLSAGDTDVQAPLTHALSFTLEPWAAPERRRS
jgi:hypothetical protein